MFYGINIKNRCLRLVLLTASMLRIRHYRGHGIHSPFAYSLVRQVFMKRRIKGNDRQIYNQLRGARVGRYWAMQLQNLHNHCRNHKIEFITASQPLNDIPANEGTIVCILSPRYNRSRYRRCKELIDRHNGMSIDNRGYILLINDQKLPKQHFKL